MSIASISNNMSYTNTYFNLSAQVNPAQRNSGKTDTVSFSAEALELYHASQAEKKAAVLPLTSTEQKGIAETEAEKSMGEKSITELAIGGGMKAKGGKSKGTEDDENDENENSSWYDTWFETTYDSDIAENKSVFEQLLEEEASV